MIIYSWSKTRLNFRRGNEKLNQSFQPQISLSNLPQIENVGGVLESL